MSPTTHTVRSYPFRTLPKLISLAVSLVTALAIMPGSGDAAVSSTKAATQCHNVQVPTRVGGQSGAIAGTLCAPPGADTLQILVPGWTYNRQYFDIRYRPATYSYAQAANSAGYATLTIDRLGSGQSLHPLSAFATVETEIRTLHQVVQAARQGQLGTRYKKILSVGHSLGSLVVQGEAGNYRDVDSIITTGFSSALNYVNAYIKIAGHDHLATSDAKFGRSRLDPLYVTSMPGTRTLFDKTSDPNLLRYDEQIMKDTDTLVEGATLSTYPITNAAANIHAPVLAVTGADDPIFCGLGSAQCRTSESLRSHERSFYPNATVMGASVIPKTSHDIETSPKAPLAHRQMVEFANSSVGHGSGQTGTHPGVRPSPSPTRSGTPSLQNQLINEAFLRLVMPTADTYDKLAQQLPGLGDPPNSGPRLSEMTKLLGRIASVASHLAPAAQRVLGG